ncbi:peptidoglycan-binding protein [Streptomyces sp. YIM 98790]|uniref:peptidoglycan-binding domain-containing protein n=1 Tax=Streptomyces sp. YIM 98790 TaxID=2689077 RepID=UPI001408369B|nr:peptidoglycan-binding domain-containing protein [Streptomyces sp. YIM 98790]
MADTEEACTACGRPDCPGGCPGAAPPPAAAGSLFGTVAADDRPGRADPADLALFAETGGRGAGGAGGADDTLVLAPVPGTGPEPERSARRGRLRVAALAGGTVGLVMGCTAAVSALIGGTGGGGTDRAEDTARPEPSLALPDGGMAENPGPEEVDSPSPEEELLSASPTPESPSPGATETGPETSPGPESDPGRSPSPTPTPTPASPTAGPDDPPPGEEPDEPPVLRRGDSGPEVEELQGRLSQIPHMYRDEISGEFDRDTEEAVFRFQQWYGVNGDEPGVYGPRTRERLEAYTDEPGGDRDGDGGGWGDRDGGGR